MNRIGRYAVYLGALLTAAGLIVGFAAMFTSADSAAVNWLGIIPVGFMVMLLGTVISHLHPGNDDK